MRTYLKENTYKENKKSEEQYMSFVGIMKGIDGIVAFGDSKSSQKDSANNLSEELHRKTQKVFSSSNFIFVTFGSNKVIKNQKEIYLETLINNLLKSQPDDARMFFEGVYEELKETFYFRPAECFHFIYGEYIDGDFQTYSIMIKAEGVIYELYLKNETFIHCQSPMCPEHIIIDNNLPIDKLANKAYILTKHVIALGDEFLSYNPVGGDIICISLDATLNKKTYKNNQIQNLNPS